MKVYCDNDSHNDLPSGYEEYININSKKDVGFQFWDKCIRFDDRYNPLAIDLLYISVFVFALDRRVLRKEQLDSWSRKFELSVPVSNVKFWNENRELLESMINYLSGDNWNFSFRKKKVFDEEQFYNKRKYKKMEPKQYNTICMLSGGLDSYIGAIDLLEERNKKILFVGHHGGGKGTKKYQDLVFGSLIKEYNLDYSDYFQFYVSKKKAHEDTTRTRSLMFFAHAIALASAFGVKTQMFIPENGFISLNVPLSGARFGSSSTRTTHPYYMKKLKELIKNMGLNISIVNPYQLKTKGEMVLECKNKPLLEKNYMNTMSCSHPDVGRFKGKQKTIHCGACIPCIIRRAALLKGMGEDCTEITDEQLSITEPAHLNKNAFNSLIQRHQESRSIFEIQKSGPIEDNLVELSKMYNRGIREIRQLFLEVFS